MQIGEVVDETGTPNDFLGHAGGDNFVILTVEERAEPIKQRLKERFKDEVVTHYNFMDRQQGFILAPDESGKIEPTPLMTLAVGMVSPTTHYFADIREITELAAEERRQDSQK
jgi:GGDEF domain-containing protein